MIIRFKKGSNSLRLRCKSQALMRFVKWISFNTCGIQISDFLTSTGRYIWRTIVDFGISNISLISRTVTWRSDSIMASIWSSPTSFGRPEHCSFLSEKSQERNLSNKFRHCLSFLRLPQHTHHVLLSSLCCVCSFTEIKKQNMMEMFVFILHLKVDAKLTTVNEIAHNLFVKQAKSDS